MRLSRVSLLEPWRTRLLWLSLGLNLFGAAILAAPHLWHRHNGPPGFDSLIDRMARGLPSADAATFRAAMARERPALDATRDRLDEARDQLAVRIVQQPFDAQAVRAALQAMQDRLRDSSTRFDDRLVAALGDLSPEARSKLVAAMHHPRPPSTR